MTKNKGIEAIEAAIKQMPASPGVYRMLDEEGAVLYVGKAKNLPKRVINYTQLNRLVPRISRMVLATDSMEFTTTRTEAEALLLEANLIKSLKPRYNILLRDDKSFPYICISASKDKTPKGHEFPRITKHRGKKNQHADYYGPYANAGAVNRAISVMQKAFLLRPCTDSYFKNRTRPCMEYEIKRCSAPCVELVSEAEYAEQVGQARDFMRGKDSKVREQLTAQMQAASDEMEYEQAAIYRNRIEALTQIQATQGINSANILDADIIAIAENNGKICVQVFFLRGGKMLGNKAYFPKQIEDLPIDEILEAFLSRFYQTNPVPNMLIISHDIYGKLVLEEALSSMGDHKVKIESPMRGEKRKLVETALANAISALENYIKETTTELKLLSQVAEIFDISKPIKRIEIYDNSHIFGKHAVGAMVVAGEDGFTKQAYRKFTVENDVEITGGDDFGMMREVMQRRFKRFNEKNKSDGADGMAVRPDLLLIDGGAGQLSATLEILDEMGVDVPVVCIAKGPERNAGIEDYYQRGKDPFKLPKNSPVAYYLQRLRDEAHRFAISSHRQKRAKSLVKSVLDDVPGIGQKRKKSLLNFFGSAKGVQEATVQELQKVEGINKKTAEIISDWLC